MSVPMLSFGKTRGRAEARRRLVNNIAKEHGHLGEDVLGKMDQETRREVEEALLKKDLMIGSSVITLAQNLYTSNARFVFELLQNADDNHYSKALASGAAPHVSFHIYSHLIVLECNEDGFTPQNLRAICNIGKSSKTGSQGYIGEKGIGFKSVFMAAWKVHIQSGGFSFCFQHRKGDSGMGMISPQWQEPEQDLDVTLTRITLFLHEAGDPVTIAKQRETISKQFHELQDTILLFLKNIARINVTFYDGEDNMASSATYSIDYTDGGNRVALEKIKIENGKVEESKRYYYTIKHVAGNLAKNENRTYTAEEDATKAYAKAEVILAFPLTDESIPIIEPQELFAFLPVRHMGFSFLIQSDFVTQANRQDIVITSVRNSGLLDGVADAFVKAVLQFCDSRHPILQYQWMRYLPDPDGYPWGSFWGTLISKIKERLKKTPVLRPRSEGSLGLIKQLRRIRTWALDQAGEPLFDDIRPEAYLSRGYEAEDLAILKPYGLFFMSMDELVKRVSRDLSSLFSKMQSPATDDDWHSRAAKMLSIPFHENSHDIIAKLEAMNLLPLHDQKWVSVKFGSVYYAESEGIPIPRDLRLKLIDPRAAKDHHRKALFDQLGVKEASTSYVRGLIVEEYEKSIDVENFDLSDSRCHLEYLYLTHKPQERELSQFRNIQVYCQTGTLGRPHWADFYVSDNEPYGAQELLKKTEPGQEPGTGAPGLLVRFLHQDYFNDMPATPVGRTLQWKEWLHTYVKIRRHLRLTSPTLFSRRLSEICEYIANHRPERFLDVLRHHWKFEGKAIVENRSIVDTLRKTKVLCKGNHMVALSHTYLPIPSLERRCARFMNDTEFFPFLMLEAGPGEESYPREWEFLHAIFEVGIHHNLDFYLAIFESIKDENDYAEDLDRTLRVYNLCETIQAQCLESNDRNSQQSKVRDFFELNGCIFIPAHGTWGAQWADCSECLWVAPPYMETKYPLESLYEDYFGRPETDRMTLTQFFTTTLEIPNASWRHFVDEIQHIKASNCTDFDRINSLYVCLDEMESSGIGDDAEELQEAFEDDALIYVLVDGRHGWYRVSECIWASATAIRGKTTLNDHYDDLKDFFIGFLQVAELDFAMVRDKLVESTGQASVAEIKDTLWLFNSLLIAQDPPPSPEQILESHIFPVKYPNGQVELRTSRTDFAIMDRQRLGDVFTDKAKLLDFNLDEVRRLKPFIRWAGLEYRYLSSKVKEISLLQGGDPTPISTQGRDVSRKAHSLFRIAVHYNSPRALQSDQSLYHLLRSAHVYETDGISSQLVLSQDGRDITTEVARSELHINEDQSGLEIYVPRDVRSRDFCYLTKLPPRLLDWMMTQHTTLIQESVETAAVLVTTGIINANQSTIDLILEAAGIIEVDVPDDDENTDDAETPAVHRLRSVTPQSLGQHASPHAITPESGSESETPTVRTPASSLAGGPSPQANLLAIDEDVTYVHSRSLFARSRSPPENIYVSSPSPPQAMPVPGSSYATRNLNVNSGVDENANYRRLLNRIVNAARRSVFPSRGSFNMSALLDALPDEDISSHDSEDGSHRLRSARQLERDKKIGAAGELFVFEILSQLIPRLPGFSRDNWQSTIRKYVTVNPEYASMDAWNKRETADIVYDDDDGVLTELLIDKGYLSQDQWIDLTPKYYIEVKSTTGACETPFYMSKHQYQRIKDSSNGASGSENPDCIYVVFRVFDLYGESPDMRVYMDPDIMRQRGELIFTAETWSVVPAPTVN